MEVLMFISIAIIALVFINFSVFKIAGINKKKRIIGGIIILILVPVAFFTTMNSLAPLDPGGFGAAGISIINSTLFLINGIIVIIIGFFT
ncbi:hypothetical protein ACM26V_06895 [Salipaludibacillus sp. HK11]|uniref:hypothetical protein n=1 Tax=Salipaludibacillus sp. HK11 TaxID=3394320 RepID=UPI0039FC62BD